ncbi:MAG: phage tail protein, partial [Pseudomonadota bacterium]
MATVVLAAAGSFLGGPFGAQIGAAVGGLIDGVLFRPRGQTGAGLQDLTVQSSAFGTTVPMVMGRARVAGNVIWSSGLKPFGEGGAKGGGAAQQGGYSVSFATAIAAHEIEMIDRVWADGKLIRSGDGSLTVGGEMRVYLGTEDQLPDALVEADVGTANASANRGLAYVVFEDLDVTPFGNRIPNLTFEIKAGSTPLNRIGMLNALDDRQNTLHAAIDADEGSGGDIVEVEGLVFDRPASARDAYEHFSIFSPLIARTTPNAVQIAPLPVSPTAVIHDVDMVRDIDSGAQAGVISVDQSHDQDVPREIAINYYDPARAFRPSVQRARRTSGPTSRREQHDLPVVVAAQTAKQAAEVLLNTQINHRSRLRFRTDARAFTWQAGDAIQIISNSAALSVPGQMMLIDQLRWVGGGFEVEGYAYDAALYQSGATADDGAISTAPPEPPSPTVLEVLDIPDPDSGGEMHPRIVSAVAGQNATWRKAQLFQSIDAGASFDRLGEISSSATMGYVVGNLGEGPQALWDMSNTIDIDLVRADMVLENRPDLAVLFGANTALVGNEIIRFAFADEIAEGRWRISRLLRGISGTDAAIQSHQPAERFVLLDGNGTLSTRLPLESLGQTRMIAAPNQIQSGGEATVRSFSFVGNKRRPLSPGHLRI